MNQRKTCIVLLAMAMLASVTFAAQSKATARQVIGDVQRYNNKKATWNLFRIGQSVVARDSITTALESEVILSLPEGSVLKVHESSRVVFDEFTEENGSYKTNVNIVVGKLDFSVQKQTDNSTFKFKTGTMAAAIRGTEGSIAGQGDIFLAGLKNGALQIDKGASQSALIRGGQIIFDRDTLISMDLISAGEAGFHDEVMKILEDKNIALDELQQRIRQADSLYAKSLEDARKLVQCSIDALPDTISNQEIQIHGRCAPGTVANFYGEPIQLESNGSFYASITLDSIAVGEKKLNLTCSALNRSFDCAMARTYYKPMAKKIQSQVIVTSRIPATVCEDGLTVEGTYQTLDSAATLFLSIGSSYTSGNLVKFTDGKSHPFTQNITITDRNGLWNAKMAKLEMTAEGKVTTREIPLRINRSCQAVNQLPPQVQVISYDSLVCAAYVSIGGLQGDIGIFRTNVDNIEGKASVFEKNTSTKIRLKSGIHDYEFIALDQAGNESSVARTLGCFPDKFFKVKIKGNAGTETEFIPPSNPSNHSEVGKKFVKRTLRFKIDLSDVSEIYSVTVKHNGVKILHDVLNQIESLDYDVPLELLKGKTHKLEIIVKHKSGHVATATKVYEVN
ncbi:MAG: FecR family protein [Fibrobacter sp.]|nr:FecR family protein [Fibrobacter sp.]